MAVVPHTMKRDTVRFVTAVITEKYGADISAAAYQLAHVLDSQKNDDPDTYTWETPHAESSSPTPSIRHVKKLVTAALVNDAKTKYRVFVRITDNPEIDIIDCGTYTVIP